MLFSEPTLDIVYFMRNVDKYNHLESQTWRTLHHLDIPSAEMSLWWIKFYDTGRSQLTAFRKILSRYFIRDGALSTYHEPYRRPRAMKPDLGLGDGKIGFIPSSQVESEWAWSLDFWPCGDRHVGWNVHSLSSIDSVRYYSTQLNSIPCSSKENPSQV